MAKNKATDNFEIVSRNRRASHDYELLDRYEAGLALTGTEIKSVRQHKVSLQRSFVQPRHGELWLMEANIAPYEQGNRENHEPKRPRKLLLHRREINKIIDALQTKGMTMVPTKMYIKDGWAKVEVALARGKKLYDKRQDIARRDAERRIERALREKYGR
ncbi:MAG: SsrA-binding protein SmpB [Candidatus Promineifilaceae bacterium]|nr:SsrA-binding protein SmpB [Candidatus Promineifilaceae bacterium]